MNFISLASVEEYAAFQYRGVWIASCLGLVIFLDQREVQTEVSAIMTTGK